MPIKWNAEKNRVLYKEDIDGNRTYKYEEDDPEYQKKLAAKKEAERVKKLEAENKKLKAEAKKAAKKEVKK